MYANVIDSARQAAAPVNPDPVSSEDEAENNENVDDEAALAVEGLDENQDLQVQEPENEEDQDEYPELEAEDHEEENFINDNHVQQIQNEMIMEELGNLQQSDPDNYGHINLSSAFAQAQPHLPESAVQISHEIASRSNSLFST